jgi:hypothetical protein
VPERQNNPPVTEKRQAIYGLPSIPLKSCVTCIAKDIPERVKTGNLPDEVIEDLSVGDRQSLDDCAEKIALGLCSRYPKDYLVARHYESQYKQ